MPDRMPEDLPDRMPEDMPEDMPEHMPEDMPEHMPEDMPDRMPDRMPEDLPVRKCINVMVGITRSKVIVFFTNIFCPCRSLVETSEHIYNPMSTNHSGRWKTLTHCSTFNIKILTGDELPFYLGIG